MLKRSLRTRSLHDSSVSDYQIDQAIEGLLKGDPVEGLPPRLCKPILTTMRQMRKDAILQRRDGLASKLDEIMGELEHGPSPYLVDTPENPNNIRSRALAAPPGPEYNRLMTTGTQLVQGAKLETVDIPTRQAVTPILKTRRQTEVSKYHYPQSRDIDRTVDQCIEFEMDSRRLGPRLLKVQEIERKLDDARAKYEDCRQNCRVKRQQFEELKKAAESDLEEKLKDEMLEFGSHVPTSLPLEFSKFSNKVLDARVKERRSAQIRKYEDAAAIRKEAVSRERSELDTLSERFNRSFKLQRQNQLAKQEQKRASFQALWQRKSERNEAEIQKKLLELKRTVDHLEQELIEAQGSSRNELNRIKKNERIVSTPVAARPKGTLGL